MFTPDPTNLIGEYLFENPQPDGTVRNTANPGTLDGTIVDGSFPLQAVSDVPPNFQGASSLDYNVLRQAGTAASVTQADTQLVRVSNFPDPPSDELTVEAWVKVDYFPPDTYPNGAVGFGACPQPICKECAYYLFLGTLQTDRNLIFTHIPGVQAGIPKPDTDLGPDQTTCPGGPPAPDTVNPCPGVTKLSGAGGIMSQGKVLNGVWTHVAATFTDTGIGTKPFLMRLYINGQQQTAITSHNDPCGGDPLRYSDSTNNPIHKPGASNLHLGMFRQILQDLDYQYSGKLCGVRIYHRALTRDQICDDIDADVNAPDISPASFNLVYPGVPEGETTSAAAVLQIRSACKALTLQASTPTVNSGPGSFGLPLGNTVVVPASNDLNEVREFRVWFSHTATSEGDVTTGSATITVLETGQSFPVSLSATTIRRPRVAIAMALDQSNSMSFPSGLDAPLETRLKVLHFSAPPFVELLEDDNSVGIVSFDQDPHAVLPMTPTDIGGRIAIQSAIIGHTSNPAGLTAIGDGLEAAQNLIAPVTGFDSKAIVILTDGHETAGKYISEVSGLINDRVFAIGLGTADQLRPSALRALTNDRDGYLLMTGQLQTDDFFRLSKYYLQILTSVTNQAVVLDPDGYLGAGQKASFDFCLNETDLGADVILLTPFPQVFRFWVETPAGDPLTPAVASGTVGATFSAAQSSAHYRFTLPLPIGAGAAVGRWRAHLEIDDKVFHKVLSSLDNRPGLMQELRNHGARFSLTVHSSSNLRMDARLHQNHNEPGAMLIVRAILTEYGLPVEHRATVRAELERPDGTDTTLPLSEVEPGIFEAQLIAGISGVYRFRVLANGTTLRSLPFTREQLLTGAVWQGGNEPFPTDPGDPDGKRELCELLDCLLDERTIRSELRDRLRKLGLDVDAVRKCVATYCRRGPKPGGIDFDLIFGPELAAAVRRFFDKEGGA